MKNKINFKIFKHIFSTSKILNIFPGFILAVIITLAAYYLNVLLEKIIPTGQSPISTIMIAIILGMIVKNTIKVPTFFNSGISFCVKKILRLGIILMGIRLSILELLKIAGTSIVIVIICMAAAIFFTIFIARKFKLPPKLGTLIAVGTSICGASAIVATGPGIDASEEEISYAVSIITIFGIIVMFAYPYLTHLVFNFNHTQAGLFIGTSVHETAQVAGASLMYDQLWIEKGLDKVTGGDVAIVTKLVRNTLMIIILPIMIYLYNRNKESRSTNKIKFFEVFPVFILGFIFFATST